VAWLLGECGRWRWGSYKEENGSHGCFSLGSQISGPDRIVVHSLFAEHLSCYDMTRIPLVITISIHANESPCSLV
jgi:hypothetical protein